MKRNISQQKLTDEQVRQNNDRVTKVKPAAKSSGNEVKIAKID